MARISMINVYSIFILSYIFQSNFTTMNFYTEAVSVQQLPASAAPPQPASWLITMAIKNILFVES